jgi:hypothetical protein
MYSLFCLIFYSLDMFSAKCNLEHLLITDYTSEFVCDFMCDLLHIAGSIWCICNLLSDKNHFLTFFCTKSQMRFGVRFRVRTLPLPLCAPNRIANRMVRVNGSNSESDTKSQTQQIADAICSKLQQIAHEIAHV